ncbi:hypothetical protein [Nakamurella endophytica]|nr:hypothetical protein [Nakamurella endophytica]
MPSSSAIEERGRRLGVYALATVATSGAVLALVLVVDGVTAGRTWHQGISNPAFLVTAGLTVAVAVTAVLRRLALAVVVSIGSPRVPAPADPAGGGPGAGRGGGAAGTAPQDRPDTVICCSGGGIKSASFCLGALQVLNTPTTPGETSTRYERADAVVAVSGGGYTAAAFAARYAQPDRDRNQRPFAPGGSDVAELRRNTNYLASTARARFDLVSWLFLGILVNLLIAGAAVCVVSWLLVEHVRLVGLVDVSGGEHARWRFDPGGRSAIGLFWIPSALALSSFVTFLCCQLFPGRLRRLADGIARRRRDGASRSADGWIGAAAAWLDNTPNTLLAISVAVLVFYPGVPWLACLLHDFWLAHPLGSWAGGITVAGVLSAVSTVAALVRSSMKATAVGHDSSVGARILAFVRSRLAPKLGVAVAGLLGFVLLVAETSWLLAPGRSAALVLTVASVLTAVTIFLSANSTSMHTFYRNRLAKAFLPEAPPTPPGSEPRRGAALAVAARGESGLHPHPRLVLCATANVQDGDLLPTARNGTTFVLGDEIGFTDETLGDLSGTGCLPTGDWRPWNLSHDPMTLDTAMAISAAAVAPLAGRADKTWGAYRLLLALANIRLGVWVRNPCWMRHPTDAVTGSWRKTVLRLDRWMGALTPFQVVAEAFGTASIYRPFLYLTDGGHYDNLGLVEGLRHRPREIVLLDGSGDAEDTFAGMGDAIASARMDLGVEIDFEPGPMQRGAGERPARAWTSATATWPGGATTVIHYLKCVLPQGLSWDLESYRKRHPGFPVSQYTYEMYDEFDFEAYRNLGASVMTRALAAHWC